MLWPEMSQPARKLQTPEQQFDSFQRVWLFEYRPAVSALVPEGLRIVENQFEQQLGGLKEKLLLMASHAEAAVNRSVKALVRRDDELARRTKEEDNVIDTLEKEIDEVLKG